MLKRMKLLSAFAALAFASTTVHATVLASSNADLGSSPSQQYYGQSFTVGGSGVYNNIDFSFLDAGVDFASGTGYLFSSPYTGVPGGLNSSDTGYLGSVVASGNIWAFASSIDLTSGQQYYFYDAALVPGGDITGGGVITGGVLYGAADNSMDGNVNFGADPSVSTDFIVTGNSYTVPGPTPEPSSLILLGTGVLGMAGVARRKLMRG